MLAELRVVKSAVPSFLATSPVTVTITDVLPAELRVQVGAGTPVNRLLPRHTVGAVVVLVPHTNIALWSLSLVISRCGIVPLGLCGLLTLVLHGQIPSGARSAILLLGDLSFLLLTVTWWGGRYSFL